MFGSLRNLNEALGIASWRLRGCGRGLWPQQCALTRSRVDRAAGVDRTKRLLAGGRWRVCNYVSLRGLSSLLFPSEWLISPRWQLIKSNESVYAPSASVVAASDKQRASRPAFVLIVADPVATQLPPLPKLHPRTGKCL